VILPADIKVRSFLGQDAISFSEIGTLARCEKAWYYSYATEREETAPSKAMALGTDTHAAWGQWHMDGVLEVTPETADSTAFWLMDRYAEFYAGDKIKCIDVEVPVAARLPGGPYFFGFADALFSYKRKLWVGELKTTQSLSNAEYLAQQLQTKLYCWAFRQMGVPVAGAMLDVIRSFRPVRKELPLADSFDRRWLPYSDAELVPAVAEAMAAVQVRRDLIPYAGPELGSPAVRVPLRNVGSSCSWCSHCAPCYGLDVGEVIAADSDAF
jgi:hypothetical protein